jgi:PAS domain S-box-containing protein
LKLKKSIARRLTFAIFLTATFFLFQIVGFYFASGNTLRGLTEMHQAIQMNTFVRQARQLLLTLGDTLKTVKGKSSDREIQTVFDEGHGQATQLLAKALAVGDSPSDVRKFIEEAQASLAQLKIKSSQIFSNDAPLKNNLQSDFIIVDQYVLETHDLLGKAQLALSDGSDRIFDRVYESRFRPLSIGIILTLLFLSMALWMGLSIKRKLKYSIQSLLTATEAVASGNLAARALVVEPDEFGLLANAFNDMTKSLQETTVSKVYTESIVESMLDSVLVLNSLGIVLRVNRMTSITFGYSSEELLGASVQKILPEGFLLNDSSLNAEMVARSKEGSHISVFVSVSRLESQIGESGSMVCVIKDITNLKKFEDELRLRNLALLNSNRELEAFSYSVSHDLRAPLRGIDGFSQALLEDCEDKLGEDGKDYLKRIRAGVQRMGHLIDDILNLARISRANMTFKTFDLSAMVLGVANELKEAYPNRKVDFKVQKGLLVHADPGLMKVAFENLIGNAWKYTSKKEHANIEFGVTEHEGKKAYFVRDNGAGFDMTYVDKLFSPFQRLHEQSQFPGSGVGLASVQRVIRRHGGGIWAEGQVEMGATFYFTL